MSEKHADDERTYLVKEAFELGARYGRALVRIQELECELEDAKHTASALRNSLESEDRKMRELLELLGLPIPTVWSDVVDALQTVLLRGDS